MTVKISTTDAYMAGFSAIHLVDLAKHADIRHRMPIATGWLGEAEWDHFVGAEKGLLYFEADPPLVADEHEVTEEQFRRALDDVRELLAAEGIAPRGKFTFELYVAKDHPHGYFISVVDHFRAPPYS